MSVDIALVGANVVDVADGKVMEDRLVLVEDGKILSVGDPSDRFEADMIVEAQGRYLLPGLSDMHAHVVHEDELTLYVSNGVTTIRNMWGSAHELDMRARIEARDLVGPRYITAGAVVDGIPRIWPASDELGTEADARTEVREQHAAGYDFIKPYSRLDAAVFDAILDEARFVGLEVSGHVPNSTDIFAALDGGMRTSEHFIGVLPAVMRDTSLPNPDVAPFFPESADFVASVGRGEVDVSSFIDPAKVDALQARLDATDHWFVLTVAVMANFTENPYQFRMSDARYLSPYGQGLLAMFATNENAFGISRDQQRGEAIMLDKRRELIATLHANGAKFLVGTDNSLMHGLGLVDEMVALTEYGMNRVDILQDATMEVAAYLGEPDASGQVKPGMRADLLLVANNPLDDFETLRDPKGLVLNGRWLDEADLEGRLEALAAKHATTLAAFDGIPQTPADPATMGDFYSRSGQALRISQTREDGNLTAHGLISDGQDWNRFSVTRSDNAIEYTWDEQSMASFPSTLAESQNSEAVPALLLTGTPLDIFLTRDIAEGLKAGDTMPIAVVDCQLGESCDPSLRNVGTLTNIGRDIRAAHGSFENATHLRVEVDGRTIDTWLTPPGMFAGGPVRYTQGDRIDWQRIR
ncbi:MAG: amidohydrolase family protein [Pseudomonadota bacterium]